jgi:hypothetical protein
MLEREPRGSCQPGAASRERSRAWCAFHGSRRSGPRGGPSAISYESLGDSSMAGRFHVKREPRWADRPVRTHAFSLIRLHIRSGPARANSPRMVGAPRRIESSARSARSQGPTCRTSTAVGRVSRGRVLEAARVGSFTWNGPRALGTGSTEHRAPSAEHRALSSRASSLWRTVAAQAMRRRTTRCRAVRAPPGAETFHVKQRAWHRARASRGATDRAGLVRVNRTRPAATQREVPPKFRFT